MSERKGEKKINYCTTLADRRRESDRRTHTQQALITGSFAPRRRLATREFPLKNRACQPPAFGSFKIACDVLIVVLAI